LRFNLIRWTRWYCGIARHCGLPYDPPKGTLLLRTAPNNITRLCTISLNCSDAFKQFGTSHCAAPRKEEKLWSLLLPAHFIVPDNACLLFSRSLPYVYQGNSLLPINSTNHYTGVSGVWNSCILKKQIYNRKL